MDEERNESLPVTVCRATHEYLESGRAEKPNDSELMASLKNLPESRQRNYQTRSVFDLINLQTRHTEAERERDGRDEVWPQQLDVGQTEVELQRQICEDGKTTTSD